MFNCRRKCPKWAKGHSQMTSRKFDPPPPFSNLNGYFTETLYLVFIKLVPPPPIFATLYIDGCHSVDLINCGQVTPSK